MSAVDWACAARAKASDATSTAASTTAGTRSGADAAPDPRRVQASGSGVRIAVLDREHLHAMVVRVAHVKSALLAEPGARRKPEFAEARPARAEREQEVAAATEE